MNAGGTHGIIKSTSEMFDRFWSSKGTLDEDGLATFKNAIELLNTDAAPDEIAACREQCRPSAPELHTTLTPNVKVVARDKAHGAQRLGPIGKHT